MKLILQLVAWTGAKAETLHELALTIDDVTGAVTVKPADLAALQGAGLPAKQTVDLRGVRIE